MSKAFRAWKIDAALLLRRDAQSTIQVQDLQWGIRVGVWPEQRRRMRIQLASAVSIVLAGTTFGLHQYMLWRSNSLGPQLQVWAQPGSGTPHLEDLTRERPARSWQRVRLRFPSRATRKKEFVAQFGPVEPEIRLAPASTPIASADPVSSPAFDPPITAAPQQKPMSNEPLAEWVTTVSAIDQGGAPISARRPQTKPQPQRDRSASKQIVTRDQGSMANVIENINESLRKAWSSVQVWK